MSGRRSADGIGSERGRFHFANMQIAPDRRVSIPQACHECVDWLQEDRAQSVTFRMMEIGRARCWPTTRHVERVSALLTSPDDSVALAAAQSFAGGRLEKGYGLFVPENVVDHLLGAGVESGPVWVVATPTEIELWSPEFRAHRQPAAWSLIDESS
jgi:hypothetical protein